MDSLVLGKKTFTNRLFTGTGKFASNSLIPKILESSGSEMITVALRRMDFTSPTENILAYIPENVTLLPNTSGARTADEAVRIARIAREAGCGDFIKIEVIHDAKYLLPDNYQTLKATEILTSEGFIVLPYMSPDVMLVRSFEDAGAAAIMPLGSPIGSNKGLMTRELIRMMIEYARIPVIVDAGIGKPSQAAEAMEMGAAAVLVNTAIAGANDPELMASAFALAVEAGRKAYCAQCAATHEFAHASSPLTGFLRDE